MPAELVCAGNLIVDDVVLEDGRTWAEPGGAVLYAALGAALWGTRVAVVAPVGDDYPRATLDALAARGVDLAGLRPLGAPGLRTFLRYGAEGRRIEHQPGRPTHAAASPAAAEILAAPARAYHLCPMPIEVQAALVEALASRPGARPLVTLDPHQPVGVDTVHAWSAILGGVDAFLPSAEEIDLPALGGVEAAAARLAAGGRLAQLVLKCGAHGGLLVDARSGICRPWTARADAVVDPTGAGDAFAAAFATGLLAGEPPDRALERGLVSASFALAARGPAGLVAATPATATVRRAEWFGAT
jgi:sugar/nucleoside kinase (ribokinase family)